MPPLFYLRTEKDPVSETSCLLGTKSKNTILPSPIHNRQTPSKLTSLRITKITQIRVKEKGRLGASTMPRNFRGVEVNFMHRKSVWSDQPQVPTTLNLCEEVSLFIC
jgi:hypothetical protein